MDVFAGPEIPDREYETSMDMCLGKSMTQVRTRSMDMSMRTGGDTSADADKDMSMRTGVDTNVDASMGLNIDMGVEKSMVLLEFIVKMCDY